MDEPLRPGEGILHHAEGVDLMPADIQLSGMEVSLVNAMSRETVLTAISGHAEGAILPYPDRLPALVGDAHGQCAGGCEQDHNSRSGRVSARQRAGTAALHGQQGKSGRSTPKLQIDGILLTMVDSRTNFAKEIPLLCCGRPMAARSKSFGTEIPHSVRAKEISAEGKSIFRP